MAQEQIIGKIFTREEADKSFGSVISSVKISPADLRDAIAKTQNYVMFRIFDGKAFILGEGRKPIFPDSDFIVGSSDVYNLYSKSLVVDLLNREIGEAVYLEVRKEVFSVTYGESTLEFSILCPPICF